MESSNIVILSWVYGLLPDCSRRSISIFPSCFELLALCSLRRQSVSKVVRLKIVRSTVGAEVEMLKESRGAQSRAGILSPIRVRRNVATSLPAEAEAQLKFDLVHLYIQNVAAGESIFVKLFTS